MYSFTIQPLKGGGAGVQKDICMLSKDVVGKFMVSYVSYASMLYLKQRSHSTKNNIQDDCRENKHIRPFLKTQRILDMFYNVGNILRSHMVRKLIILKNSFQV